MNRHRDTIFILALLGALVAGAFWLDWSGCARVCEANGDANGWDVRTGCYCRDDGGLYNPKDSRD